MNQLNFIYLCAVRKAKHIKNEFVGEEKGDH